VRLELGIDVSSSTWRAIASIDRKGVERSVTSYLSSLIDAMCLPIEASIRFAAVDDIPPNMFRVKIERDRFRVSPETGGPPPLQSDTTEDLAVQIGRALFRAREALITDAVVDAVWKQWRQAVLVPGRRHRRWLIVQCVRYGWPLDEIGKTLNQRSLSVDSDASARKLWFELLRGRGPGRIGLRVSKQRMESIRSPNRADDDRFEANLSLLGDGLYDLLGIRIGFRGPEESWELDDNHFQVTLNALPFPPCRCLDEGEILVNEAADILAAHGYKARSVRAPRGSNTFAAVHETPDLIRWLTRHHRTRWSEVGDIALSMVDAARAEAGAFLTPDVLLYSLEGLDLVLPKLAATARNRIGEAELAALLQDLLRDGIGIRDQQTILTALTGTSVAPSVDVFSDLSRSFSFGDLPLDMSLGVTLHQARLGLVRKFLAPQIGNRQRRFGESTLECLLLARDVEVKLAGREPNAVRRAANARRFLSGVRKTLATCRPVADSPLAVLTTREAYLSARALLRLEFPRLAVMTYATVGVGIEDIKPLARVELGENVF
jgi:hypothetical protein